MELEMKMKMKMVIVMGKEKDRQGTRAFGARWCRAFAGPRRKKKISWCALAVGG